MHESNDAGEAGAWHVQIDELDVPESVEAQWRDLQARADHSFFQSWGWIGAWLRTFPTRAGLLLLRVSFGGRVVGLSVLGRNVVTAGRLLRTRALLISEAGVPEHDALTVEHSGMLMERGLERDVLDRSLSHLRSVEWPWDELFVSGVEHRHAETYLAAAASAGMLPSVRAEHPYFFVDLARLRSDGHEYLSTLSANTRHQIRRSLRLYGARGAVTLRKADSLGLALDMFNRLKRVHQTCWVGRGEPGAFSTDRITSFHEQLIASCFDDGGVELIEVRAGNEPFGYLYNFVLDGVVSNYQTGFVYESDARLKPGLVSHAMAIDAALKDGHGIYDFLMGDQRFKRSLAKNKEMMLWLVLGNPSFRSRVHASLRALRRWLGRNG